MNLTKYKKISESLPQKPGIYFWKKNDEILYIGKATNLRQRTASYLQEKLMQTRGPLIVKMIEESDSLETRQTESVLEALLMETHLIKKHQPAYNSKEKDNKSHNYVVISKDPLPRIYTVRGRQLKTLEQKKEIRKYFGPFPQGQLLKEAMAIIKKIFPYLGKKKNIKNTSEFYKQIGLLPDLNSELDHEKYEKTVSYIEMLFSGKKASIIRSLESEMKSLAKDLKFEQAARIRNQISSLKHIRDIALMKHDFENAYDSEHFRIEAYDIAHLQGEAMLGVMVVHDGVSFVRDDYRVFTIKSVDHADDTASLQESINRRFRHSEWQFPDLIVVDGGLAQKRYVESSLRELGIKIPVVSVVKDEKHKAKGVLGQKAIIEKYKREIMSINAESHRFAISQHRRRLRSSFLD